ncbi:MAG TPA: hypothetical protein VK464_28155 [Symbiobacteriaceae bacterium]|jgi:peptidoglycan/LPS O-acetylase OafA/YrhL|nr:hypothetical protein [Symbiobacteriaceae bacterium]
MRGVLYATGCGLLLGSAGALAFLPRFAPTLWQFGLAGAILSLVGGASWVALSATAGNWPRPQAGPVLAIAGILALIFGLVTAHLVQAGWAGAVCLTGLAVALVGRHSGKKRASRQPPGPVRPPLGHRQRL